jgi:hypothetical protein
MAVTYDRIASTTLSSNADTVTFSGVPNTYTDIRLVMFGSGNNQVYLTFNGSTTGYSAISIQGDNTSAASTRELSATKGIVLSKPGAGIGTGQPVLFTADIMSYKSSKWKTVLGTGSMDYNGNGITNRVVGMWRNTSTISTIGIFTGAVSPNVFYAGTVFTLYGILEA